MSVRSGACRPWGEEVRRRDEGKGSRKCVQSEPREVPTRTNPIWFSRPSPQPHLSFISSSPSSIPMGLCYTPARLLAARLAHRAASFAPRPSVALLRTSPTSVLAHHSPVRQQRLFSNSAQWQVPMKAIQIEGGTGPSSALYIGEVERPVPKEDEVLVKVRRLAYAASHDCPCQYTDL